MERGGRPVQPGGGAPPPGGRGAYPQPKLETLEGTLEKLRETRRARGTRRAREIRGLEIRAAPRALAIPRSSRSPRINQGLRGDLGPDHRAKQPSRGVGSSALSRELDRLAGS